MRHAIRSLTCCALAAVFCLAAWAADETRPAIDLSTEKDALRAIDLGLRWLAGKQHPDGHWSLAQYPAITALVVRAFLRDPARPPGHLSPEAQKGIDFILGCVREDGGIYVDVPGARGGGLRNYNTAICLATLAETGTNRYDAVLRKARAYLVRSQHLGKDEYYGGWGYDAELGRPYADVVNTAMAVVALHYTQFVVRESCKPPKLARERPAGAEAPLDPDWKAAVAFLARCQNLPSADGSKAVSPRPTDHGGLFYEPKRSMAGGETDAAGRQTWYSYGNATYSGLMCFLLADVPRDDPKVAAALGWARRNYTIEEHAGLGRQGLFFYYHTMARALWINGEEPLNLAQGGPADWRRDLLVKVTSLQRVEPETGLAYWVNDVGRWMENDPVLVSAYCLLTLETLLSQSPKPPAAALAAPEPRQH